MQALAALRLGRGGWLHVHENITSLAAAAEERSMDLERQGREMGEELAVRKRAGGAW